MGIPYSREINAAFEQVTPLVAAGYQVLRTTKNISILLAIIQVLTVVLLFLVWVALIALMYCVNPDLEHERRTLITPALRALASLTLYSLLKSLLLLIVSLLSFAGLTWWFFVLARERLDSVEREGNEDADEALKELDGKEEEGDKEKKKEKGKKNKGKKGEGKKKDGKDGKAEKDGEDEGKDGK